MLIKKECLTTNSFNPSNNDFQDLEAQLDLVKHYNIYIVNDVVMTQRVHKESGTHSNLKSHLNKRNLFFISLLDKYGVNFFKFNSDESDYQTLTNLGDICMKNNLDPAGKFYFRKAFRNKPITKTKYIMNLIFMTLALSAFGNTTNQTKLNHTYQVVLEQFNSSNCSHSFYN